MTTVDGLLIAPYIIAQMTHCDTDLMFQFCSHNYGYRFQIDILIELAVDTFFTQSYHLPWQSSVPVSTLLCLQLNPFQRHYSLSVLKSTINFVYSLNLVLLLLTGQVPISSGLQGKLGLVHSIAMDDLAIHVIQTHSDGHNKTDCLKCLNTLFRERQPQLKPGAEVLTCRNLSKEFMKISCSSRTRH